VTASTPRLLLLDGHSLAYRAFFALPVENFSTTTGQPTNAVYGFTSMLINVLRDERPTHIVVAFDVSRRSFRTERYAEYKAGRAETPGEFAGQVSLVKEVLAALRVPTVEKPGYEADDVLATLACQGRDAGMEVLICTGDRDAFQLVGDRITVLYPTWPGSTGRRSPSATASARSNTGTWRRWSARPATTSPACREWARRRPRSGSCNTAASRVWSPGPTRSRARPATTCANGSPT
jgi:DNA polymerase-1